MGNLATLYERLGFMSGSVRDMNTRARYLREAGLMGRSSRDLSAPDFDAVHAAIALLSCMSADAQIDAPASVRRLWGLRWVAHQRRTIHQSGIIQASPVSPIPPSVDIRFGQQLVTAIDVAASNRLPEEFEGSVVWRGGHLANTTSFGQTNIYGTPNGTDQDKPLLLTVTHAPRALVQELGSMVRQNREEASRRGIKINVEDAYRALGDLPPDYQPTLPLAGLTPSASGVTESENAALPGAAPSSDLTAQTAKVGREQSDLIGEREKSQSPLKARAGHSYQHPWSDPHDRRLQCPSDRVAA